MTAARLALIVLAVGACKHGPRADAPVPADTGPGAAPSLVMEPRLPPSKVLPMTTRSTTSYVTPWVDGTRASHVAAAMRALGPLTRVVDLASLSGPLAARPLGTIEHLLVAPDGQHLVLRGADAASIFDRAGKHVGAIPVSAETGLTFATKDGVFHGGDAYDWAGTPGALSLYVPGGRLGRVWATHVTGSDVFFVNQEPLLGNHEHRQPARMQVVGNHLVEGPLARKLLGAAVLKATEGMGAIARDGRIALLTVSGDLHVYAPRADESFQLHEESASHVKVAPYEISIVGESIAVLEAHGAPAITEDGLGPYQIGTDVFLRYREMSARWTTTLHLLSMSGAAVASVSVPFEVLEPPVDGGAGRIYLAGTGLAAVQDGHVLWSQPRGGRTLATAFAGGEVALAVGDTLRIVDRAGTVRQSFTAPGETFATPPAIAEDGSVWIATDKGIYAAR